MLKIIVNGGQCAHVIGLSLESLATQTYRDWDAWVTIDPCGDGAYEEAIIAASAPALASRVHVTANQHRMYSLYNQIAAIKRCGDDPEDVIVSLDGDDWFCRPDALQIIADTYASRACWMTYGSWYSRPGAPLDEGGWPAYPDGLTDFRQYRWLGTAVRTWKRWLYSLIEDMDLRDDYGQYFRVAEDRALMWPMLEMSGTQRAAHISECIMYYNQSACSDMSSEAERNVALLMARPPRARIRLAPLQNRRSFAGVFQT